MNQEGINKLEAIMLANGQYFYDQKDFGGVVSDCRTNLCGAGFARLLAVGPEQYNKEALGWTNERRIVGEKTFPVVCMEAGRDLLGLSPDMKFSPPPEVFNYHLHWPEDLMEAYREASTPQERIAVYINMLRTRANDDGSIREAE